jgi:hypothetical protein
MNESEVSPNKSAIKAALARDAYERDVVRIADADLTGVSWLVASPRGVFAISGDHSKTVVHGWFFGIHRHGDALFLFENCGYRDRTIPKGRVVRIDLVGDRLGKATVLVKGLHSNCHQLAIIDGLLCVLDTANQAILRYTPDGRPVDVKRPFPPAAVNETTGAYLHFNSVALVGDRIALMLHNGCAVPEKTSELAWLDRDWTLLQRHALPGFSCHDILEDETGILWHTASMSGEIIGSNGARINITDEKMTRGLAMNDDAMIVGVSNFGARHVRHALPGGVVILDRQFNKRIEIEVPGAPTDIIAL